MALARRGRAIDLREDDGAARSTVPDVSRDRMVSATRCRTWRTCAVRCARVLAPGDRVVLGFTHPCGGVPGGPPRGARGATCTRGRPCLEERRCEEVGVGARSSASP